MWKLLFCLTVSSWALAAALPRNADHISPLYLSYMNQNGRLSDDMMEDSNMTVMNLIKKYGYQGEEHRIQTEDGYILTLHRILPKGGCTVSRRPVLLQHGLLCSSADWITSGPENSLGYLLADACHDVWMGNSRGNRESKAHAFLDVNSDEFWQFSWHEMGVYDLPSVIDYILAKTGYKQLNYVGHSQGTTEYMIMDSLKPQYAAKVRTMYALAPIAYMEHSTSNLLKFIAHFTGPLEDLMSLLGINEFLPGDGFLVQFSSSYCDESHSVIQGLCSNVLFILCGFDPEQINTVTLPVVLGHTPAGASTRQLLHYGQSMNTGLFRMYDFGKKENQKIYGQNTPPEYPLQNATSSYALFCSENDSFANMKDVDRLYNVLPNPVGKFKVGWEKFNHLDYLWGKDVKTLVYDQVMELMSRDNGN